MFNDLFISDAQGNNVEYLTQWDVDQSVKIDLSYCAFENPIVHFSNSASENALAVNPEVDKINGILTVKIPNILLKTALKIKVYIFDAGRTIASTEIPVRPKEQPLDYVYSDNVDVVYLSQLQAEVNGVKEDYIKSNNDITEAENGRETAEFERVTHYNESKKTLQEMNALKSNLVYIHENEINDAEVEISKNVTIKTNGTYGDFAISDGRGGIIWKTIADGREVAY